MGWARRGKGVGGGGAGRGGNTEVSGGVRGAEKGAWAAADEEKGTVKRLRTSNRMPRNRDRSRRAAEYHRWVRGPLPPTALHNLSHVSLRSIAKTPPHRRQLNSVPPANCISDAGPECRCGHTEAGEFPCLLSFIGKTPPPPACTITPMCCERWRRKSGSCNLLHQPCMELPGRT